MPSSRSILLVLLPVLLAASHQVWTAPAPQRHLVIVVDGLRPDYVTADVMPNLTALGRRGIVFRHHHSVYPTVTRVNAASISTGAYPETHGLMGNAVFFPRVDAAKFLDTGDREQLLRITEAEGRLLTAPTLGESLRAVGKRMLVVSSGSTGSAWLNNHTVSGGAVLHPQFVLPADLHRVMETLGPPPSADGPATARDRYAVEAFLKVGVPRVDPSVTVLWLGALDATAHDKGVGAPETVAVLRHVDVEIGRLQDGLKAAGLLGEYTIWVTSDHGFSTYTGAVDLAPLLAPFARTLPDGSPRVVASGGAIYVRDGDEAAVAGIVASLQRTPGIGAIFTRVAKPGSPDGRVPGTLSFDVARWSHDRSAQILFSPDWTDAANTFGMKGTTASNGTAGHGSTSPWDIHNTLIAAGAGLKQGVPIDAPSANVDFAPTLLRLLGAPVPPSVQGRPLIEALAGEPALEAGAVRTVEHTASTPSGGYAVTATLSIVSSGGREYRYFDRTRVVRKEDAETGRPR